MTQIIQTRRDTAANWTSVNPILANGEMGLETDTVKIKWGNGVTAWNSLAYFTGSGGGGLNMKGTATIDFGATPGTNVVVTAVADVNVTALSAITVFMESDSTATHNAIEHQIAPIKLTAGDIVAGVGFNIYAVSDWRLDGTFTVNYLII